MESVLLCLSRWKVIFLWCFLFWGCPQFWGHLHFFGHLHLLAHLHYWGCLHFWGCLYFWGCLHFWGRLIFWGSFNFWGRLRLGAVHLWRQPLWVLKKKVKANPCDTKQTTNQTNSEVTSPELVVITRYIFILVQENMASRTVFGPNLNVPMPIGKLWLLECGAG